VLINASLVEEIHPWTTGEYVVRIKGGKEFNVSRTYRKSLHSITPLWLGTDGFGVDWETRFIGTNEVCRMAGGASFLN